MMLPSLGHFSEVPCVFFLAGSCSRPHCHFRHCPRDKTNDDGKLSNLTKTGKDDDVDWLGPNLRLLQVTHMVEKAVDRALLANPDKKLDRATMISQTLETLRRDSQASKVGSSNTPALNPSTSAGFPSYKPTPISILNKRHIPVVAMPVKPMVIRKDKRLEEKTSLGVLPVISVPPNNAGHTSTINVDVTIPQDSAVLNAIPAIPPANDSLETGKENDSIVLKYTDIDGSVPTHQVLEDIESTEQCSAIDTFVEKLDLKQATINENSNAVINIENENEHCSPNEHNSDTRGVVEEGNEFNLPSERLIIEDVPVTVEDTECVPHDDSPKISADISKVSELDKTKHKDKDRHKTRSHSHKLSDRRHSSDSKKASKSSRKSNKSSHSSSKHAKDVKADPDRLKTEKNGEESHKKDDPPKKLEKESCHKKLSRTQHDIPNKCSHTKEQGKPHVKMNHKTHHEKMPHHKSTDKDNQPKEKHHHSRKQDVPEIQKKNEQTVDNSNTNTLQKFESPKLKHSSSSHSKSRSSEKRPSSQSKDHHKAKKRKAHDGYEKQAKVAKVTERDTVKAKNGEPAETVKRRHHSDSETDVDFIDPPSPSLKAIVISSSSSDEQDDWASPPEDCFPASKSDIEDNGGATQSSVVDFKWSKAKEIIQRSTNPKMPRIAHVPNVMSILTAKTRLLSQEKKLPVKPISQTPLPTTTTNQKDEHDEGPQPKIVKRVAHGSQGSENRPVIKYLDNTKLPPGIRQHYCNVFYEELCKYLDPEKAKRLAVEEELDVAKRCKIHKIYQNNCSLLLLKIRKMKGNIDKDVQTAVKWSSSSTPEFTYGLTLYKCFEKYVVLEEDLVKNGYPMPLPGQPTCAYIEKSARKYSVAQPDEPFKRRCVNCRKTYEIDQDGMPTTTNDCTYHWGRMRKTGGRVVQIEKYTCCDGADDSLPCQSNEYHVWSGRNEDCIPGFVRTREWPIYKDDSDAGVFALDCEMCYTTRGLELARLTVVDLNEDVIFDEVVALDNPVLDYCTRFSGIDEDKMREATMTFQEVQKWVLNNFFDKTILVGHSLENDLNALKVFHKRIVDTSITFPHKFGPPMKNSLKNLAMSMLALPIQENEKGHDSKEDAVACLKLMMKQIKEDAKVRKPRVIIGYAGKKR